MTKKPSLTKILAEAAFNQAWYANTPAVAEKDPKKYQQEFDRYRKRFEGLPDLALRTVARAASAEANRSIKAYESFRPLPVNVRAPINLPADASVLADLIARYRAK